MAGPAGRPGGGLRRRGGARGPRRRDRCPRVRRPGRRAPPARRAARTLGPDWLQAPGQLGYAAYADRFAGDLAGVRERDPVPARARRHLPAPHAAAAPAARATTTAATRCPTTAACGPTSAPSTTCARWRPTCARRGSASCSTSCSTTSPASTRGRSPRAPATRATARTSTSSPTASCPTPTSGRCRRSSPTSRRAASPGTTSCGGWVWTTFNAFQWDVDWANPDVFAEYADIVLFLANARRRGAAPGRDRVPVEAARHQLPEPARGARDHPGAARGGPDRLPRGGLQGRGDRRAARTSCTTSAGRAPRQGERPRLPQQPHGAGLVDARGAGRRARRRTRCGRCRRCRRPRRGSPTCAATTTSAGRSTTATPPPSGCPGRRTGRSCPTSTAAGSPARRPAGWSSRTTPRPATGGSAAPPRSLAGLAAAGSPGGGRPGRRRGRCSRTRSCSAGAGCRCSGPATSSRCPTTRDWAAEPGHAGDNRWAHRPRLPADVLAAAARRRDARGPGLRRAAAPRAGARRAPPPARLRRRARCLDLADPGVLPVLRRHPVGPLLELYNVTAHWRPFPPSGCARRAWSSRGTPSPGRPRRPATTGRCGWRRTPRAGSSSGPRPGRRAAPEKVGA